MIEAFKPQSACDAVATVVYKGPCREVSLDSGHVLRRGERCELPLAVWEMIEHGAAAEQFVRLETARAAMACGGAT